MAFAQKLKATVKRFSTPDPPADAQYFSGGVVPIDQTEPQDVFLVGYPKSGNTMMQHIISHLVYGLNEQSGRSMVNLIAPDVYASSHYFRLSERCFFKSHDLPSSQHRQVIYIVRDGRQALLSYHRMLANMGHHFSLDDLYMGKADVFGGQWHEHVQRWEENPFGANILWLKYEDLRQDKLAGLRMICDFLNINRSEAELSLVSELTSLSHMQSLETRKDWQQGNQEASLRSGKFIGQGKTNSFRDHVPTELLLEFENRANEVLDRHYPGTLSAVPG